MKKLLKNIHKTATFFGFDIIVLTTNLSSIPYFIKTLIEYYRKKQSTEKIKFNIQLLDRKKSAGEVYSHYFWQDLIVAKKIFESGTNTHADIGSRLDGFITHLLSFKLNVTIFDIRPLDFKFEGLTFRKLDLMKNIEPSLKEKFDSLSCLHTIEHFGLGRYGDPLNANGHEEGIQQIQKLVKPGGSLYLSFPVGKKITYFNAHRVIEPSDFYLKNLKEKFDVKEFILIDELCQVVCMTKDLFLKYDFSRHNYSCGIFILEKYD